MNDTIKNLVTNKNLLRIDQDIEARPAFLVNTHPWGADKKVLFKHLSDGEFALGFFNLSGNAGTVPFYFDKAGIPAHSGYGLTLTDVFTGEELGFHKEYMNPTVEAHDCKVYLCKLAK